MKLFGTLAKFFVALAGVAIFSCSSPVAISNNGASASRSAFQLTLPQLHKQAYIGGSVLYNPDNPSSAQIQVGVPFGIRLGKVSKQVIDAQNTVYKDVKASEQFGELDVTYVDAGKIDFNYQIFDSTGNVVHSGSQEIKLGSQADLNGDGVPDVEYKLPAIQRVGFEKAVSLNFLSSKTSLTTTMYAILPSFYPAGDYPNGIVGINPSGNFLVEKYAKSTTNRVVAKGLVVGDYLLDSDVATYKKVLNPVTTRALGEADLSSPIASSQLLQVLPLVNFEFTAPANPAYPSPQTTPVASTASAAAPKATHPNNPALDAALALGGINASQAITADQYTAQHNAITNQYFSRYQHSLFSYKPGNFEYKNSISSSTAFGNFAGTIDANLVGMDLELGVYGSGNISWSSADITLEASALLDAGQLNYSLTGSYDYPSADIFQPVSLSFPSFTFAIGPVVISVGVSGKVGVLLAAHASAQIAGTIGAVGLYGAGVNFGANWGIDWDWLNTHFYFNPYANPYSINNTAYLLNALPGAGTTVSFDGNVSLTPYVNTSLRLTLWGCLYAQVGPTIGLDGQLSVSGSTATGKVTGTANISLQENLNAEAGLSIASFNPNWNFNLMSFPSLPLGSFPAFPDITLPQYKVTYDPNGATGGSVPTDGGTYLQGLSAIVLGNLNGLSKTGFFLTGWNTKPDGSGTTYGPITGALASLPFSAASAITLYAQWLPGFIVTYDGNGQDSGSVVDLNYYTPTPYLDSAGLHVNKPAYALGQGNLVKAGYTFAGWSLVKTATLPQFQSGYLIPMGSGVVPLYAVWTKLPTYTVTYDPNGATSGSVPVDSGNFQTGAPVQVQANVGALRKTGYALTSWNTKADGTGTAYGTVNGGTSSFSMGSANVTLYAQWSPTYSLTYNGNGATGGTVPTDSNIYLPTTTVPESYTTPTGTIQGNPGALTKPGYALTSWNTQANGSGTTYGTINSGNSAFSIGSGNVVLYAQWSPVYTVTYNSNGATSGSVPVDSTIYTSVVTLIPLPGSSTADSSSSAVVLGNSGNLVKTAKVNQLGFWNTMADGTGASYPAGSTLPIGAGNTVLYAQYVPIYYHVTYSNGGFPFITVPVDNKGYKSGDLVTLLPPVLSNGGPPSTFSGWQLSSGSILNFNGSTFIMGTTDVTFTATDWYNP